MKSNIAKYWYLWQRDKIKLGFRSILLNIKYFTNLIVMGTLMGDLSIRGKSGSCINFLKFKINLTINQSINEALSQLFKIDYKSLFCHFTLIKSISSVKIYDVKPFLPTSTRVLF